MKKLFCILASLLLAACILVPGCVCAQVTLGAGSYVGAGTTITVSSTPTYPAFSPAAGTYSSAQSVAISCPSGSTPFYTTNGYPANEAATEYTGPISVAASQTVNAECVVAQVAQQNVQASSTDWKCNAPGAPVTSNGWTCEDSGGVSGTLSSFNFTPGSPGVITASTTQSTSESQLLFVYNYGTTAGDTSTHITAHTEFAPTQNYTYIANNETDTAQCCDNTTNAFHQFSFQCNQQPGNPANGTWMIAASGSWVQTTITQGCPTAANQQVDVVGSAHWIAGDTGCGGDGCMYLDSLTINGTVYAPLSNYCATGDSGCALVEAVLQPTYSHFVNIEDQIDLTNTTTSGANPTTAARDLYIHNVTTWSGTPTFGSAAYTIE